MRIFSNTFNLLEQGLQYSASKQKAISQNIANIDTPNYKAKDISFKAVFAETLPHTLQANRTDARHHNFKYSQSSNVVINRHNTSYQSNGNNVDMDREMAEMAQNQIYYQALVERLNGKFNSLSTVIRGGK